VEVTDLEKQHSFRTVNTPVYLQQHITVTEPHLWPGRVQDAFAQRNWT